MTETTTRHTETMVDHATDIMPRGLLHDAGEVTVVTRKNGRVTHRYALVIAFDDADEMQAAVADRRCQFLRLNGVKP